MKFTSEYLMKAMGLQVNDKVKTDYGIYVVKESVTGSIYLVNIEDDEQFEISDLLDTNYDILPRPKRVGDLKCDWKCEKCPIAIPCTFVSDIYDNKKGKTYFEIFEKITPLKKDQEIHDLLKARLDKEVIENEIK